MLLSIAFIYVSNIIIYPLIHTRCLPYMYRISCNKWTKLNSYLASNIRQVNSRKFDNYKYFLHIIRLYIKTYHFFKVVCWIHRYWLICIYCYKIIIKVFNIYRSNNICIIEAFEEQFILHGFELIEIAVGYCNYICTVLCTFI